MGIFVIAAKSATVWLYVIPPLSILIGWRLLGEQPTISLIFSGAMILTGVIILTGAIVANSGKKETAGQAPPPDKKLAKGKQAAASVTSAE